MSRLVITLGNEDIVNLLNGRAVEFGIKDVNLIRQGLKDVELHVGMDIPMKYRNIDETKTKITRFYGCRNCHHKFRTVETIIVESEENKQLS